MTNANAALITTKLCSATFLAVSPFMAPVPALMVAWPTEGTIAAHHAYKNSKKILEMNGCDERTIKALLSIKFRKMDTEPSTEVSPNRPLISVGADAIPRITEKTLQYLQNSIPFKDSLSATDQLEKVLMDKYNFQNSDTEIFDQASGSLMTEIGWQKVIAIILKETPNLPDTIAKTKDSHLKKLIKKCRSKFNKQKSTPPKIFDKKALEKLDVRQKAATHNVRRRLSKPNNENDHDTSDYKTILERKITPEQWKNLKAEQIEELGKALTENAFPKEFVIDNIDIWTKMSREQIQKTREIFIRTNNKEPCHNTTDFIETHFDIWQHMNEKEMYKMENILNKNAEDAQGIFKIIDENTMHGIKMPAITSIAISELLKPI